MSLERDGASHGRGKENERTATPVTNNQQIQRKIVQP